MTTATARSLLILLGFGLVAAMAVPGLVPAQNGSPGDWNTSTVQPADTNASPDLLAYLAFLDGQERIRADAQERWTATDRRVAIERYRQEVDRRAWTAGMAKYEAEHLRRRADFSVVESKLRYEADARIRDVEAQLAEFRRAAEEDARRLAGEELAADLESFKGAWDDAETTTIAAMAFQRDEDRANVDEARGNVRASYAPDPTREARWVRASAWSAAEREVRQRTTATRMAADRRTSEAAYKVDATAHARAKLHGQLTELRRRDAAVIAGMRRDYERGYQERTEVFAAQERALRAEAIAELEQLSLRRAEEWARFEAGRGREKGSPRAGDFALYTTRL